MKNFDLKNENPTFGNVLLSAGFSYKFVGNFTDTKRNKFKREVVLKEPIFGLGYVKLMSLVTDEDIDCIFNSIELHKSNGDVVIKDKIDYIFSDLCGMLR